MIKRIGVCLVAALMGLWGAAGVALAKDELVVYSGRSDKFVKPVVEEFTKRTGIEVLLHNASSTELLNKMRVEGERTQADLYLSNDAGNLEMGGQLGLFQPLPAALTQQVDARWRSPDNTWLGLSARARVLVVNTKAKDIGFVKSVFDLADPRLKGRLAITNSANESYVAGVTVYMEAAGKDKTQAWLKGMKENVGKSVFSKHGQVVNAVAEGKYAVGLVNHYYIYRYFDEAAKGRDKDKDKDKDVVLDKDAIRILVPDQGADGMGVAWNVAGVAISKHTKKRELAEKFVSYLASPEGQKIFAEANYEYPTRADVPTAAGLPKNMKVADVPLSKLGPERDATLDLIEAAGMP